MDYSIVYPCTVSSCWAAIVWCFVYRSSVLFSGCPTAVLCYWYHNTKSWHRTTAKGMGWHRQNWSVLACCHWKWSLYSMAQRRGETTSMASRWFNRQHLCMSGVREWKALSLPQWDKCGCGIGGATHRSTIMGVCAPTWWLEGGGKLRHSKRLGCDVWWSCMVLFSTFVHVCVTSCTLLFTWLLCESDRHIYIYV